MANFFKKNVWTQHSHLKIKQYGLSKNRLLEILHKPERKELGIVPGTTAVMKTNKKYTKNPSSHKVSAWQKKVPGEIWLMYKNTKNERKIISCWRYPGVSKPGEKIPIPDDIKQEIISGKFI